MFAHNSAILSLHSPLTLFISSVISLALSFFSHHAVSVSNAQLIGMGERQVGRCWLQSLLMIALFFRPTSKS